MTNLRFRILTSGYAAAITTSTSILYGCGHNLCWRNNFRPDSALLRRRGRVEQVDLEGHARGARSFNARAASWRLAAHQKSNVSSVELPVFSLFSRVVLWYAQILAELASTSIYISYASGHHVEQVYVRAQQSKRLRARLTLDLWFCWVQSFWKDSALQPATS